MHELLPLPFEADKAGDKISADTINIHHDKLYKGYVDKRNEIEEQLKTVDWEKANQVYSALRGLKEGETFAANGQYLHQWYFAVMGGDGKPSGKIVEQIEKDFGSIEKWRSQATAVGLSARGWSVTAWDFLDMKLHIYQTDAQNQGAVWGAVPIIPIDVYEHSYFKDFGSDRKAYIEDWLDHLNWEAVNKIWEMVIAPKG